MSGIPLVEKYGYLLKDLLASSTAPDVITTENVYQTANPASRKFIDIMMEENLLEGSKINGVEHFKELYTLAKSGKRCLVLSEHFSNMDLPAYCYMLEKHANGFGKDLSARTVAMAGMKLNEANAAVKAWAEAFSRVVIYPSRSLKIHENQAGFDAEMEKSKKINMAAMRAMDKCKKNGHPILVFPSGTRYRPNKPETRTGLREINSYLRTFDYMILVSINGNCLRINPNNPEDMTQDLVTKDTIILSSSPVIDSKKFRKEVMAAICDDVEDKKAVVVQSIMDALTAQHDKHQEEYRAAYKKATGKESDYYV
ncbi:MAG TPA: 1-acyl-sn-glycerol-3-phosphate acyltransferase [Treponemataceae bacterium]|nr:1-acyl-sn-glycerol-3-phosphate acyltransferase [Treponemataceae bacterium]